MHIVSRKNPEFKYRQELLGLVLTHAGSGMPHEVDSALQTLVDLAVSNAVAIGQFSSFITGILDCLDAMTVAQARPPLRWPLLVALNPYHSS